MRRWISSARPDAKRTIRYLPRRSTCSTRSPVSSDGDDERILRPGQPDVADLDVLEPPALERRRDRAPNGLDLGKLRQTDVEQDRVLRGRLVAELVGREDRLDRLRPARLVAGVDLGQQVTLLDARTALDVADDADRVVDLVLLGPPARAEVERGHPDSRSRPASSTEPARGAFTGEDDRRLRQRGRVGIAALRADPALVDVQRRAVRDRGLGARAALPRR